MEFSTFLTLVIFPIQTTMQFRDEVTVQRIKSDQLGEQKDYFILQQNQDNHLDEGGHSPY